MFIMSPNSLKWYKDKLCSHVCGKYASNQVQNSGSMESEPKIGTVCSCTILSAWQCEEKKVLFWLLSLFTQVTVKSNIFNFRKVIMQENLKQNIKSFSSF